MPEQMRMDVTAQPLASRPAGDSFLNRTRSQAVTARADEQRQLAVRRHRGSLFEPACDCIECVLADRHDASLAAFAEHPHRAIAAIDIAKVEADELRQSQAGRIEQL